MNAYLDMNAFDSSKDLWLKNPNRILGQSDMVASISDEINWMSFVTLRWVYLHI